MSYVVGDLAEQHPVIFEILLSSTLLLLLPNDLILLAILKHFGISPTYPNKGQSRVSLHVLTHLTQYCVISRYTMGSASLF